MFGMKKGSSTGKMVTAILAVIFGFYIIINALVPQLADWATALSSVNSVDYGWTVYLAFLVLVIALVYGVVKKSGMGSI